MMSEAAESVPDATDPRSSSPHMVYGTKVLMDMPVSDIVRSYLDAHELGGAADLIYQTDRRGQLGTESPDRIQIEF